MESLKIELNKMHDILRILMFFLIFASISSIASVVLFFLLSNKLLIIGILIASITLIIILLVFSNNTYKEYRGVKEELEYYDTDPRRDELVKEYLEKGKFHFSPSDEPEGAIEEFFAKVFDRKDDSIIKTETKYTVDGYIGKMYVSASPKRITVNKQYESKEVFKEVTELEEIRFKGSSRPVKRLRITRLKGKQATKKTEEGFIKIDNEDFNKKYLVSSDNDIDAYNVIAHQTVYNIDDLFMKFGFSTELLFVNDEIIVTLDLTDNKKEYDVETEDLNENITRDMSLINDVYEILELNKFFN